MKITKKLINRIKEEYGETFYILDTIQFKNNYRELLTTLKKYYSASNISYSYKTNYIPRLCKIVNEFGGYAETVSDMEVELAKRLGVPIHKIIMNGPYKKKSTVIELMQKGGTVNIDSLYDFRIIEELAEHNPERLYRFSIRCNFDVQDGRLSRFGFDIEDKDFKYVLQKVNATSNLEIKGFHCHFASRNINYWKNRIYGMLDIIDNYYKGIPEYISVGGGIYGKMPNDLKLQFSEYVPMYEEYAKVIGEPFKKRYDMLEEKIKPKLFVEPGSALSGDVMYFATPILSIKSVRGKQIATLLGSVYNINPTLNGKNPPINIISFGVPQCEYTDLDMGGYTCIESDYLYKGFSGKCAVGDYVVFGNVGSYSVVLKPPFILPNFPVIEVNENDEIILIKEQENFEDIFHTYIM